MATLTNITKNTGTMSSLNKGGYALWGDTVVTWGDSILMWGSPVDTIANASKNTSSITNITKN